MLLISDQGFELQRGGRFIPHEAQATYHFSVVQSLAHSWVNDDTPLLHERDGTGNILEPAAGQFDGAPPTSIWCDIYVVDKLVPLTLSRLPEVLSDVECFALEIQLTELGDSISILKEHLNPLHRCECWGSEVPIRRLKTRQYTSENYKQEEEWRLWHDTLQRWFKASRELFQIKVEALTQSEKFTYLGRIITYNNRASEAV